MTQRPAFRSRFVGQKINIHDVAMRDGLQIEPIFVPTEQKIDMVNALSRTGLKKIEVTSFTSPKAIPALRDAEELMKAIDRLKGVTYVALIPNMKGAERALLCAVDELNLVLSASETHNLANTRMTREQSKRVHAEIIKAAKGEAAVNISISTAFGCPMEGDVPAQDVIALGDWFVEHGATGITLCDTTGMGLANALAGLNCGITRFDAALGGLGGCPYAPGATGNVCTEDLVHMFETVGCDTGVNLDALIACSLRLPEMVGHDCPGQVAKAGKSDRRYPAPADLEETRARALARDLIETAA